MLKYTTWIKGIGVLQASKRALSVGSKNPYQNSILGQIVRLMTLVVRRVAQRKPSNIKRRGRNETKSNSSVEKSSSQSVSDAGNVRRLNQRASLDSAERMATGLIHLVKSALVNTPGALETLENALLIPMDDGPASSTVTTLALMTTTSYWSSKAESALSAVKYLLGHLALTTVTRRGRFAGSSVVRVIHCWQPWTKRAICNRRGNIYEQSMTVADGFAAANGSGG